VVHTLAYASGWALAWWGLVLYWLAGLLYLKQFSALMREVRSA
jgi:cardiolipin synthase